MNRFDRRHLPTKKKSIMSINGYTRKTPKQKINNNSLVKLQQINNTKTSKNKELNFELLEAKIKSIEDKYEERIMKLELKVLEQQDTLERIQKRDEMKQQMISNLKSLKNQKEINVQDNSKDSSEDTNDNNNVIDEKEEDDDVKKMVSKEIQKKKIKKNVHFDIEE